MVHGQSTRQRTTLAFGVLVLHDADTTELVPLWKQRKDLLTVLVAMRRQGVMVSSI